MNQSADLTVESDGHVAVVTLTRPPHNHVDADLMRRLADVLAELDGDDACRAIVLRSGVRAFCAGADFSGVREQGAPMDPSPFYAQAMRLFGTRKPIVAAVRGAAVGAGLGLALVADFRVTCREARFSANFTRLGFHPGFGLSLTLPRLIGEQKAALLCFTGRRIDGAEAVAMGLADELAPAEEVDARALALAREIAGSAPRAVESIRATLRRDLHQRIVAANRHELALQLDQFRSADFREGVAAMAERRAPVFERR
ncbi:MAG: enoyl-CoA hydratase/isomerase family protein [Variovorax sp.]|jgi:enoyl-CoA hydratase/carnithine racemase|nr:MAG: enoyl-CoA hydratase/isomerase family protein [Variovorax sp.]